MRPRQLLLVATAVSLFALPSAATSGVRDERPNLVGGEVGGRGLLLTLNYERFISSDFGLGVGIMAVKVGGEAVVILPLYASFVPGDTHSPYLSAGTTMLSGGGEVQDWESTWVIHASAGYQYHSRGGFFVRLLFTYMRATGEDAGDGSLVWPGLTIGGSF